MGWEGRSGGINGSILSQKSVQVPGRALVILGTTTTPLSLCDYVSSNLSSTALLHLFDTRKFNVIHLFLGSVLATLPTYIAFIKYFFFFYKRIRK